MHPKETRQYRMSVVNEDIFLCARAISRCEIRPACAAIAFGNTQTPRAYATWAYGTRFMTAPIIQNHAL